MSAPVEQNLKGKRHYWTAFGIWVLFVIASSLLIAIAPGNSLIYKGTIIAAFLASVFFLISGNSTAKTIVGVMALLGLLGTGPGACALADPETQKEGFISLIGFVACGIVWHAFLWSDDVSAYVRSYRNKRGLPPSD